ncbi:MAG: hypothetical protein HKN36_05150 [Hellea sp.]|nr:hypothetical protein [Hellea sp.]
MAKKKSGKSSDKSSEKRSTGDAARRIWLAGIGAYGRAFSEAQEALKDVTGNTSKVFDDLVQKGEIIESAVSSRSKKMMEKAGVPGFDLDDRISKMRSRLSRGEDVAQDLSDLEKRVNAMDVKLDKILALLSKPAPKSKPKKPTTTKRTSSKK